MVSEFEDNAAFSEFELGHEQIDRIEKSLHEELVENGVNCAVLIDMAGNIVARSDNGEVTHDLYSLAALASANFAAVDTMAKIVGEQEFSLLFHKGENESIHFSRVHEQFLLITIFTKNVSLGFLRLKVAEAIGRIEDIWQL